MQEHERSQTVTTQPREEASTPEAVEGATPVSADGWKMAGTLLAAAGISAAGWGAWRWLSRREREAIKGEQGAAGEQPLRASRLRRWLPIAPAVDEVVLRARLADLEPLEIREKLIAAWGSLEPWQWREVAVEALHGLRSAGIGTRRLCGDLGLSTDTVVKMTPDDHATLLAWVHKNHPGVLVDALAPHHHAVDALGLIRV